MPFRITAGDRRIGGGALTAHHLAGLQGVCYNFYIMGRNLNLLVAITMFVGSHFVLSSRPVRQYLIGRFGELRFLALYSVAALIFLIWTIAAYLMAPYTGLWVAPVWVMYLPVIVMPFALYLIVDGYLSGNPMSVGQERMFERDDPAHGVVKITRHPAMWGIALWAFSHLLPNGDLASVVLFAGMLALALGGAYHIDHRRRQSHAREFARFSAHTSFVPFAAIMSGRSQFTSDDVRWLPLGVAAAAYLLLLVLHRSVIGVAPWPL